MIDQQTQGPDFQPALAPYMPHSGPGLDIKIWKVFLYLHLDFLRFKNKKIESKKFLYFQRKSK
jgi:hypothetical protein